MKKNLLKITKLTTLSIIGIVFLNACGNSSSIVDTSQSSSDEEIIMENTFVLNDGRTLGSQCAQCHGTNGISTNSWDSIAGEDDIVDEVFEHNDPIMDAQAKGYSIIELKEIGKWLSTLDKGEDDD